jgi:putative flavoprotein involved in K+ transport
MGYYLTEQERDFIILDASERVGDSWRNRWDSLRLFTPARYDSLPGMAFPASDGYYPTKDEMADYLEAYADRFDLPVHLDTSVKTLTRNGNRYLLETDSQRFFAANVVVATGAFHTPTIPAFAEDLNPAITQLHSSSYQRPTQLPDGDVLVVGTGNSGAEIAVELAATSRHTWLSGRDVGSIPLLKLFDSRVFWVISWLSSTVFTVDTWLGRILKQRLQNGGDPRVRFTATDIREAEIEWVPRTEGVADGTPRLTDGRVLDVDAVVWATGFRPDYSWIELPGVTYDEDGYPIHHRGVIDGAPGLYVVGLPYQYTLIPTISGIAIDASYIADHLLTAGDSQDTADQPVEDHKASPAVTHQNP